MPEPTATAASPFARMQTPALWVLRTRLVDGVFEIGCMVAEGRVPDKECAPRDTVQIQATMVDAIDAVLLSRGEKVPAPFWE